MNTLIQNKILLNKQGIISSLDPTDYNVRYFSDGDIEHVHMPLPKRQGTI